VVDHPEQGKDILSGLKEESDEPIVPRGDGRRHFAGRTRVRRVYARRGRRLR
jgi:hypothetical protein